MNQLPPIANTGTSIGRLLYFENDEFIGRALYEYGEWSELENIFLTMLMSGTKGTVIDVGANIGYQGIWYSGQSWVERVFSFECHYQNYALLVLNNLLCKARNHYPCLAYISESDESLSCFGSLNFEGVQNFGNVSVVDRLPMIGVPVPNLSIDKYFHDYGQKISLIKVDVEGSEYDVIVSAKEIIKRNFPIVFFEVSNAAELCRSFLIGQGYTMCDIKFNAYRPSNFKRNPIDVWKGKGYSLMTVALHADSFGVDKLHAAISELQLEVLW